MKKKPAEQKKTVAEGLDERFEKGLDTEADWDYDAAVAMQMVNVTFPLALLKEVDAEAKRLGINRQALIKTIVDEELRSRKRLEAKTG